MQTKYYIDIDGLISYLKKEGFAIGVDTYFKVAKIISHIGEVDLYHATKMLKYLFCKSEDQQRIFDQIIDVYVETTIDYNNDEKKPVKIPKSPNLTNPEPAPGRSVSPTEPENRVKPKGELQRLSEEDIEKVKYDIYLPLSKVYFKQDFKNALASYRQKTETNRKKINIKKTLQKTISKGVFHPVFDKYTRPTEYVFFIQYAAPNDLLAKLYESLVDEITSKDIAVSKFYFYNDLRKLYSEKGKTSLSKVIKAYSDRTLIIFAAPDIFIDLNYNPKSVLKELKYFTKKILIVSYITETQQANIKIIEQFFDLIITDTKSHLQFLPYLLKNKQQKVILKPFYKRLILENKKDWILIKDYFDKDIYNKFLFLLSAYPDQNWRILLLIAYFLSSEKYQLNTWEELRKILSIDILRKGYIPDKIRELIINNISDTQLIKKFTSYFWQKWKEFTHKQNKELWQFVTSVFWSRSEKETKDASAAYDEIAFILNIFFKTKSTIFANEKCKKSPSKSSNGL